MRMRTVVMYFVAVLVAAFTLTLLPNHQSKGSVNTGHAFSATGEDITNSDVPSSTEWKVEISKDSVFYSKVYSVKGCTVSVYKDGSGLVIKAVDFKFNGEYLVQTVTIQKNQYGGVGSEESFYQLNHGKMMLGGSHYDVFYVHYREIAKSLPPDVKKLFAGHYGIE